MKISQMRLSVLYTKVWGRWGLIFCMLIFSPLSYADILLKKEDLLKATQTSLLKIEGQNFSSSNITLVIRADDTKNPSYSQRANIERVIPSGAYSLLIPLASLRTPSGRQLSLSDLQKIMIFTVKKNREFVLKSAQIITPKPLHKEAYAWDLGPLGSAIWPGFKPLSIESGLLLGKSLQAIDRSARMQGADALTIDGVRGIESVTLPLPAGNWQITLWMRDSGEWEYLPHPLIRQIFANGKQVYGIRQSPQEWIKNTYLRGQNFHVSPKSQSWALFGAREKDRFTFNVTSDGAPIILRLKGDSLDAQFLSAILVTPQKNPHILEMLKRQRKAWWEKNWPVSPWEKWPRGRVDLRPQKKDMYGARGTSVLVEFEFEQSNIQGAPLVFIQAPKFKESALPATWHWTQWQLTRTRLSSTLLKPNDDYLRHGLMRENTGVAMPKKILVRIDIPKNAQAGSYKGSLNILLDGGALKSNFAIHVLKVKLPPLTKPVGIYLEKPVHFGWFKDLAHLGDKATLCDLHFLKKIGFTGISPPFSTPQTAKEKEQFASLSIALNQLGFITPLAYAPAKRLSQALGANQAATIIAQIETSHKNRLQPAPYWSIADEPSNPGNIDLFKQMHRNFKIAAPSAKLAGHLNHTRDKSYLPLFDLVLINEGFGVDKKDIQEAQKQGRKVWLYNLPNPRASAGFYLWKTKADGFLKWHGRMPTADPFDPTDGREVDAQFLYPSLNPCPKEPDIHRDLYKIMDGITDHRWLLWLEKAALSNEKAKALLKQFQGKIPDHWEQMQEINKAQLQAWREQIMAVALSIRD